MRTKLHYTLPLTLTALIAAWQIAAGHPGNTSLAIWAYTFGFGVLLVASLWLILMGLEVLSHPAGVLISALIPLSVSLGLVTEYALAFTWVYLGFVLVGWLGIATTQFMRVHPPLRIGAVAFTHGVAGFSIVGLPLVALCQGQAGPFILGVSVGGAVISLSGMLLLWQRMGRLWSKWQDPLQVLPWLLLLSTFCLVIGLNLR